ncbi:putative N-acetylated-alpha-linked acidic dipeptidase [Gigantopelta aegis]|uniref:putative N-acetylated-alpha-linked acidic dipeptidase n=1 Tax=Gigantopelta aegis TaxID=1735272 RepID=UPI001B88D7B8|nr:putative N-acetylated-alpha-linked acidic dipeptidase [Gigantopelta aegis]
MATKQSSGMRKVLIVSLVAIVIGFVVGILIGRFATCPSVDSRNGVFLPGISDRLITDGDPAISDVLINEVKNTNIEQYLRELSSRPHLAGTPVDLQQAEDLKQFWLDAGFDDVKLASYDVLLSAPDPNHPNFIRLLDGHDNVVYESPAKEANLTGEDQPDVVPPFNAYSAPGKITNNDLVYVNYGRVEDYNFLENNASLTVNGKIVLVRYGKIFRGSKVQIAERHGALGIIMFSDPADYTWPAEDTRVYPQTWWLPPSGAQRGTTFVGSGDPLTPNYPALDTAYRYSKDTVVPSLPKIPAHPIGYGIAEKLLREMAGQEVPPEWRGGINITYRFGSKFKNPAWKIQMDISTNDVMRKAVNVIGIIRGAVEPDRYIMFGNHRDAWVYGAIDPSSGTAVMKEVSRVLAVKVKSGKWRPRRSIMFCSWGAEEYGLVGSTEWVQHYIKNLRERAVAYLNIDIAVQGNYTLRATGTPLLIRAMFDATKKVPNPNESEKAAGRPSVYDTWFKNIPWKDKNKKPLGIPKVGSLGSGSDYAPLLQKSGVTGIDFRYTYNTDKYKISSYPLYHSVYETFYAVKNLMDKQFKYHQAVARVGVELTRNLADSLIIPFNVSDYAWQLEEYRQTLDADYGSVLRAKISTYDKLQEVIANFSKEVEAFNTRVANLNRNDPMAIRMVNDQLTLLEKAFLDPQGLPDRPTKKHIIFAENSNDAYAGSSFPGLVDILFEIDKHTNMSARWEQAKLHFSVILYIIDAAAATLRDVTGFVQE